MAFLDQTPAGDLVELSEKNKIMALLGQYGIDCSASIRDSLSSEESRLRQELKRIVLSDNQQVNKHMLQMLIVFFEDGSLETNRALLQNHSLIKSLSPYLWDPVQFQIIPALCDKMANDKVNYSIDLVQHILSHKAYYRSYQKLLQLQLTQDLPRHFANDDKRAQLIYIDSLLREPQKTLCLILWGKSNFSLNDLKEVIEATEKYPMLAATLVALNQNRTFIYANDLRTIALNPKLHQYHSILHHFAAELKGTGLNKTALNQLDVEDLAELSCSLIVLRQAGITSDKAYSLLLNKDNNGQMLRLFIPELAEVEPAEHRKTLINLLYLNIQDGIIRTGKALQQITDKPLAEAAEDLLIRYICVKQLLDLRCKKEPELKNMLALAAQENNEKATRFRQVILNVEAECKDVQERLRRSAGEREKVGKWQQADEEYRRTLYCLAYDAITQPGSNANLRSQLVQAERRVLRIVDPAIDSLLHRSLIIIANIVITALTLGLANEIKMKKTGNFWFFNQTVSGEKLRALDKEILMLIEFPKSVISNP